MAVKTLNEVTEIREVAKIIPPSPTANSLDVIFVAPSVAADGIEFVLQGRELVLMQNSDPTNPYTFTLKSEPDELLRDVDVGPYTLQAGEIAAIIIPVKGFKTSTGKVLIVMENAAVKVGVLRLPAQIG